MQFDPLYQHKKIQDDLAPIPNKPKRPKRKLILLTTRKYMKYKGTMKRVRVEPVPAIPCVVMRRNGETNAVPMRYIEAEKRLVLVADGFTTVFPSRSEAKKAIYHTCQRDKTPYADFKIANKV